MFSDLYFGTGTPDDGRASRYGLRLVPLLSEANPPIVGARSSYTRVRGRAHTCFLSIGSGVSVRSGMPPEREAAGHWRTLRAVKGHSGRLRDVAYFSC